MLISNDFDLSIFNNFSGFGKFSNTKVHFKRTVFRISEVIEIGVNCVGLNAICFHSLSLFVIFHYLSIILQHFCFFLTHFCLFWFTSYYYYCLFTVIFVFGFPFSNFYTILQFTFVSFPQHYYFFTFRHFCRIFRIILNFSHFFTLITDFYIYFLNFVWKHFIHFLSYSAFPFSICLFYTYLISFFFTLTSIQFSFLFLLFCISSFIL